MGFKKATEPAFVDYATATLRNAKALAASLIAEGATLVTGGTDNHPRGRARRVPLLTCRAPGD